MEELTSMEKDTIAEVGNISLGSAATALSDLLGQTVRITAPQVEVVTLNEVKSNYPLPCLVLQIEYTSGLKGENVLIIKERDASVIAGLMMGVDVNEQPSQELGEVEISAVGEAMNQMMGYAATSMSEMFQRKIDITPPKIEKHDLSTEEPGTGNLDELDELKDENYVVQVAFRIEVGDLIDSTLLQIVPVSFAREMTNFLIFGEDAKEPEETKEEVPDEAQEEVKGKQGDDLMDQDEIEKLLAQREKKDGEPAEALEPEVESPPAPSSGRDSEELTVTEKDTIAEVGNISMGSAATALSNLLGKTVRITTPQVEIVTLSAVKSNYPIPCLVLQIEYTAGLRGENVLIIKEKDATIIAGLMMGFDVKEEAPVEMGEVEISAVGEAMNQMMGYTATSMSELFYRTIDITPPSIEKRNLAEDEAKLNSLEEDEKVVQVSFRIEVEDLIDSNLLQIIPISFAREMTNFLLYGEQEGMEGSTEQDQSELEEAKDELLGQEDIEKLFAQSGKEAPPSEEPPSEPKPEPKLEPEPEPKTEGSEPSEQKIYWSREPEEPSPVSSDAPLEERIKQLDMVKDVPVKVTVILGRNQLPLGKLLNMGKEGIIELDRYDHEPVDIYVNEMLVGRGEVVVVNGQLGVRITSIDLSFNKKRANEA